MDAVQVEDLAYSYNGTEALRGVGFTVRAGEIFGLLGPNGGGKTTVFRILSTLLRPAGGQASVFGVDVAGDPLAVRRRIGVVFQNQSLDRRLTAWENLVHQGHLYGLQGKPLEQCIDDVLTRLGLANRKNSVVETLSGGPAAARRAGQRTAPSAGPAASRRTQYRHRSRRTAGFLGIPAATAARRGCHYFADNPLARRSRQMRPLGDPRSGSDSRRRNP